MEFSEMSNADSLKNRHESPLVSCIMPTSVGRIKFLPISIAYFQRQSYLNTELIIVDDGTDDVNMEELVPEVRNIRYHKLSHKLTIGMKRNRACELAKGEIIMNWDDDDWYSPAWIEYQVHILKLTGADICGLRNLYFYEPTTNNSWKYVYADPRRPWVAGATFAYKRDHWLKYPYKDIQVGEDNDFVWNSKGKVYAHDYIRGFVSILHNNNTSPKHTNLWHKEDPMTIVACLQTDIRNYSGFNLTR